MDPSLRLITYLVPSLPVEMFECVAHYLEEALDVRATLQYESRNPVDLFDARPDPFLLNEADLGFMNPMQYLKMKKLPVKQFELMPISPVFVHPKNAAERPGYYSDIIMHKDVEKTVKSFLDLRGSSWGYTGNNSLSSSLTIQKLLRSLGENSSFFGNTIDTGNHLLSVRKVQDKQVTAAAVDSTAFYNYKNVLHRDVDDICVLDSVGPLPPYAIVCNKKLSGELKSRIVEALSDATSKRKWGKRFEKFGLIGFADNSDDAYLEYNQSSSQKGLSAIYY
ncbi:uncharacterized protein LOC112685398 [Sipha flava]|uniref:Uncharacterized protein LOC112685398 n=1 Tax=Sipha flava TaxID=143950 RepID=A0A2S2Q647_9HEMI|nr:uncharacterized protein LOC112685398 [Sipha flava]